MLCVWTRPRIGLAQLSLSPSLAPVWRRDLGAFGFPVAAGTIWCASIRKPEKFRRKFPRVRLIPKAELLLAGGAGGWRPTRKAFSRALIHKQIRSSRQLPFLPDLMRLHLPMARCGLLRRKIIC